MKNKLFCQLSNEKIGALLRHPMREYSQTETKYLHLGLKNRLKFFSRNLKKIKLPESALKLKIFLIEHDYP